MLYKGNPLLGVQLLSNSAGDQPGDGSARSVGRGRVALGSMEATPLARAWQPSRNRLQAQCFVVSAHAAPGEDPCEQTPGTSWLVYRGLGGKLLGFDPVR